MSKELTDDWKTGKLKDGDYYVKLANDDIIIEHLCKGEWCFDYGWRDVIVEVLARCDYDHFVELTKKAKKYDRIKINGNYPDKISKLKSRIKYLLELQANQDKELKSARWYQTIQNEDIAKLRQLLGECQTGLKSIQQKVAYPQSNLVFEEDYDALFCQVTDILTKIDEVLK